MCLNALFCAFLIAFGLNEITSAQPQEPAQATAAATNQGSNTPKPLSIEERRERAMASLLPGRIKRPATYDDATPEEKVFVDSVLSGSRTQLSGDLGVLMLSPAMGDLAQKAIAYARFNSTVPAKLNELAIIITARTWSTQAEWRAHRPAAIKAGLSPEIVEAIRLGKRPANMPPDVEAVYNFCVELLDTKQVSDATLRAARNVLGTDQRLVDLIATLGMYQFVAMTMNVDQTPLPAGVEPELMPLPSSH
jgi:4-carboxymuconolactone decarboxylase